MDSSFTDESIFEIVKLLYTQFTEQENNNKLDAQKLAQFKRQYIKPLYPHKSIKLKNGDTRIQKYSCSQFCCDLSPGRFFCCQTTESDEVYKDFGLGICIYSKFMKHLTFFLLFVSILSLIPILLYYMVGIYNQYNFTDSYNNFLFSGSVGIVSSSYMQCQYRLIENNSSTFSLLCPVGRISMLGPVFTNQSKADIQNCRMQQQAYFTNSWIPTNYTETSSCTNQMKSCNVSVSLSSLTHSSDANYTYSSLSYNYQCQDSLYPLGDITLSDQIVIYIIVGMDLVLFLAFSCFLLSENFSEKKQTDNFKKKRIALDDFSLQIKGFKQGRLLQELDYFIKYFNSKGKDTDLDLSHHIAQIKINETEIYSECIKQRREKYQQLYKIMDESFFQDLVDPRKFTDYNDFIKKSFGNNRQQKYILFKTKLEKSIKEFVASKKIKFYESEEQNAQTSVILVFTNPLIKRKVSRSAQNKCFRNQVQVYNNKYQVSNAPVADMIQWQNIYKWTCCRVLFAWILTIIFCFCSYLLVGLAVYEKTQLSQNNQFNQDCEILFSNTNFNQYDSNRVDERAYHHCYCYEQLFTISLILPSNCTNWFYDYALYLAIPILISVGIVIYNLVISKIFKLFSKFEAHDDITSELFSYTLKRTFVLILNMGLVLILVNLNYHGSWGNPSFQFLFEGTYSDITSDWYENIGVVITITLCFNIFLPILQILVTSLFKCLRKLWDTQCCTINTSKKTKKQFIDFYSSDIFPIEERYADLLSIMMITLTFSVVMPLMYFIAFLSIGFMFLSDKFLLFKIFQKPLNFSSNLHNKVFKVFVFFLLVHCVVSPLLLSAPGLIQAGGVLSVQLIFDSGSGRINNIIQSGYLIPYIVIFAFFVIWILFYITLVQLCTICFENCTQKIKFLHRQKLDVNFFSTLNNYQLKKLKFSLEKQIGMIDQLSKNSKIMKPSLLELTEGDLLQSTKNVHLSRTILQNTVARVNKIQFQQRNPQVALLGKAGYDDSFNDQVLYRDQKIQQLDKHLKRLSTMTITNFEINQIHADKLSKIKIAINSSIQ